LLIQHQLSKQTETTQPHQDDHDLKKTRMVIQQKVVKVEIFKSEVRMVWALTSCKTLPDLSKCHSCCRCTDNGECKN